MKVGLFYGSETGNTRDIAFEIQEKLVGTNLQLSDDPWDFADEGSRFPLEKMLEYQFLLVGVPTWNIGELQADVGAIFHRFDQLDFRGKLVAIFGCGDRDGYPDTYQDAIGLLGKKLRERGATLLGLTDDEVPEKGLIAVENGRWLGLVINLEDQKDTVHSKIEKWVAKLLEEFKL